MKKEIVIAAYDKNLDWLNRLNANIKKTIYRKGNKSENSNEIYIENNKGRCVHTFFNHILSNYNNLSDITYFVQDYPFDHWENVVEILNEETTTHKEQIKIGGYYGYHWNTITTPSDKGGIMWSLIPSAHHGKGNILMCNSNGSPQDTNPLINVDEYWNILFHGLPPNVYEFMPGGHFGLTKEHAQLRSKEFYTKIVNLLLKEEVAPWLIERLECYIFNINYKTKF
jgi:hypothetical protein